MTTSGPLRVGILGAARIAPLSIVAPARATGARLAAVAARDPVRAEEFAAAYGVERVLDTYAALLGDPGVEAVYNPLPNGLHGPWNLQAVAAGKHLLTEKPAAANAAQARAVRGALRAANRGRSADQQLVYMEGYHFPYHPLWHRVMELLAAGAIGEVQHVDVPMLMPDPGADDPRWRLDLAGGATMDLGCYSLTALNLLGEAFCGGALGIETASTVEHPSHPGVDSQLFVAGGFPSGATGSGGSDMNADGWSFTLVITGTEGEIVVPTFPLPHQDDRLILRSLASRPRARTHPSEAVDLCAERDGDKLERLGNRSSYTYQLEAFTAAVREGGLVATNADFSVANMEAIDSAYRLAGLDPRA